MGLTLAATMSVAGLIGSAQPAGGPDALYVNGTVITMGGPSPTVEAVAVKGDRIVGVGRSADLRATASAATRIVDLRGQTLLPGFIDAHSHFPSSGVNALLVADLSSPPVGAITSIDEARWAR